VPGFNDSDEELGDIARFLVSVSPDVPWHVTAFHKDYKMTDPDDTGVATLLRAARIGAREGLHFVYAGNVPGAVGEVAGKAVAAVKGQVGTARAAISHQAETHLRNAQEELREEHVEIALYSRLVTFAEAVGDRETAQLAKAIRRDEERMAKFLDAELVRLVKDVVRAEVPRNQRPTTTRRRRRTSRSTTKARASSSTRSSSSRTTTSGRSRSGSTGRSRGSTRRPGQSCGRFRSGTGRGRSRTARTASG